MQIEIGAPACLPLALIRLEDGTLARLGVTLRYPPVNLTARSAQGLDVTGARADHVAASARRYLRQQGLPEQAEVEIELAIPSLMGLGSDALVALTAAQAVAWVHQQAFEDIPVVAAATGLGPEQGLEIQAYAQGGLLLVEAPRHGGAVPALLRRQPLNHPDDAAWAFVLFMPRVPTDEISQSLEAERLAGLLAAGPHLSVESGRLLEAELWPALVNDDIEGFGHALLTIQSLNAAALEQAGTAVPLTPGDQAILDIYREHGAVAWGRSQTGLALYALIRGASPSVAVRRKVVEHVGIQGGTVLAAIIDNSGARHVIQEAAPIYTGASPLVAGNHTASRSASAANSAALDEERR